MDNDLSALGDIGKADMILTLSTVNAGRKLQEDLGKTTIMTIEEIVKIVGKIKELWKNFYA